MCLNSDQDQYCNYWSSCYFLSKAIYSFFLTPMTYEHHYFSFVFCITALFWAAPWGSMGASDQRHWWSHLLELM